MSLAAADSFALEQPKVSIIIPVYNMEKYLEQCLDSVVNQTLKDIEIICINDGSTDNSLQIIKDYAARDTRFVILDQENTGQGLARNKCIQVARGEYLAFVDPDDWIDVHMYEEMYNAAMQYGCDVVECKRKRYHEKDRTYESVTYAENIFEKTNFNIASNITYTWHDVIGALFTAIGLGPCTRIYHTAFFKKNNIVFTDGRRGEDQPVFFASYLGAKKIHYIDKAFYFHRINNAVFKIKKTNTQYKNSFTLHKSIVPIFKKHGLYEQHEDKIDAFLSKQFITFFKLIPKELHSKFIEDARDTLSPSAFTMFLKRYSHYKRKRWIAPFEYLVSFRKKKIEDQEIKVLFIFNCPVMKFNVRKK